MPNTRLSVGLRPAVIEVGVALLVVGGGVIAFQYGWQVCLWLLEGALGTDTASGFRVSTLVGIGAAGVLLVGLYGLVGLGVPSAYWRVRGFDPEELHPPTRQEGRWVVGLGVLTVSLVGAGTLLGQVGGGSTQGAGFAVPVIVVGDPVGPVPQFVGGPDVVTFVVWPLLLASALGVGVGGLVHGVLHRSLRRLVAPSAAVVGTASVLTLLFGRLGDPLASVIVLIVSLAAGAAYERTGQRWVPIVAYAALNGIALVATVLVIHWTA